ncbi:MAG: flagellar biosynthesis protein FlgN [Treponema sp.]|jgi:hypothetical protein|nr:flagellar biosynthesis protein FlgN [Treponema sp.]
MTVPPHTTESAGSALAPEELAQRVAILKRFRELLLAQRDRFRTYLDVLDKQQDMIEKGNADDLIAHVEMEEKIVADIFSIQKVIDPLEDMYRAAYPETAGTAPAEIPGLKSALEELKLEAVARTERNKELLSRRMDEIRSEIKILRANPYRGSGSAIAAPSLIDIKG